MRTSGIATALVVVSLLAGGCSSLAPAGAPGPAPAASGYAERLYLLDCGQGRAGDLSRWTVPEDRGRTREVVDTCVLVRHRQGWLLWDTGVPDAVAAMPDGLAPADPGAIHWTKPVTLAAQLKAIGVAPADIRWVAISHSHPDHTGNLALFPGATLLVQRAEYNWPSPQGPRFPPAMAARLLDGDLDLFQDGSVRLLATPGHTPGHQSLVVRLRVQGTVVLTGDAVHFSDNWAARRVPRINVDAAATRASMERLAAVVAAEHATLWINHDKGQRAQERMAPAYYE